MPSLAVTVGDAGHGADDLLGRDAVELFREHPHEGLAAAGDDVGLVAIGAQVLQHLLHRLVAEIGVGSLPARMSSGREPCLHLCFEFAHRHPGESRDSDLLEVGHREFCDCVPVAGQHGLERLDIGQLGFRLDQRRYPIEAVDQLRVCRLLDPKRSVLIERRDALFRRYEAGARLVGCYSDEFEDRATRRSVIPGGERAGLCLCRRGADQVGPRRQRRERGEEAAPIEGGGS